MSAPERRGRELLADRYRTKGTAVTPEERDRYGLNGLLPPPVEDLETQLQRVRLEYDTKRTDLGRHVFLRQLQGRSSVHFYRFPVDHLEEVLPIVYTPTVGLACQEWSWCGVEDGLAPPHSRADVTAAVAVTAWEPRYDPD